MQIALNRRSGVPFKDQLFTQIELAILNATLAPGARLPSVRGLARRVKVHPNTVSAAYRELAAEGHVTLKRGSGVYVREAGSWAPQDARDLDELLRLTLRLAQQKGWSAAEIRAAVERWLASAPPERVVVVDPVPEMAAVLVNELAEALQKPVSACTAEEAAREPGRLAQALIVVLPYHLQALRQLLPHAALEVVNAELGVEDRRAVLELPAGSLVLVVASSPTLLPFARVLFRGLRGDELMIEARALAESREWRKLLPAADLVVADVVAAELVRRFKPRRLREVRLVPPATVARLRSALDFVVPR